MTRPKPGEDGEHVTFCRLCEAFCGLIATVEGGRVTKVVPDRANPHSQGHACVKGTSIAAVTYDPDRVIRPLKRVGGPGEFEAVSWDEALSDIAARLTAIRTEYGGDAIAGYLGNPTGFASNAFSSFGPFLSALGSKKLYGAGSQDSNARLTAYYMIHGGPHYTTLPDLPHTDFLLMLGANPLVSNGWMIFNPRWRHDLDAIAARGRVVVVDPRRTETARRYEHVTIKPDGDVWLMIAMIATILAENLFDRDRAVRECEGLDELAAAVAAIPLATCAAHTGLSAAAMATLAREFAAARRAVVYAALGTCRGRFGTLGAYLSSVLNALTGRYGAPGGVRFPRQLFRSGRQRVGGWGGNRTRIGGVPTIANKMATALLPADIEEPGEGRVRAFLCSAGNPVVSAPGGTRLEAALGKLDLHVSFDLYVTETNRHAHYVLPALTFLEREDWPMIGMHVLLRPFLQHSPAVVPPVGEARDDYWIYRGIAGRMGLGAPHPSRRKQWLAKYGQLPDPNGELDHALRAGPVGDAFGKRPGGWSRARLANHPHGVMLDEMPDDPADWPRRIGYPDGRLRVWHPIAESEFARLAAEPQPAPGTLRLIGRRDIRSLNSWLHNVDKLVRSQESGLLMHPADAATRNLVDGATVEVANANGAICVPVTLSDDVAPGTLSYPHGWGHRGGSWQRANATAPANMNLLLGLGTEWVEGVSGMSLIDCLDVEVRAA